MVPPDSCRSVRWPGGTVRVRLWRRSGCDRGARGRRDRPCSRVGGGEVALGPAVDRGFRRRCSLPVGRGGSPARHDPVGRGSHVAHSPDAGDRFGRGLEGSSDADAPCRFLCWSGDGPVDDVPRVLGCGWGRHSTVRASHVGVPAADSRRSDCDRVGADARGALVPPRYRVVGWPDRVVGVGVGDWPCPHGCRHRDRYVRVVDHCIHDDGWLVASGRARVVARGHGCPDGGRDGRGRPPRGILAGPHGLGPRCGP